MTGNGPKSSRDLIREANERLQGSRKDAAEPLVESHPVPIEPPIDTSGVPPAEPATPEPRPLQYRSVPDSEVVDAIPGLDQGTGVGTRSTVRRWMTTGAIRILLAALVFGGWYFFTSLNDADRAGSGEIVSPGQLDVMSLQVGDCFNDPEDLEQVVFDVAAVPCSEAHDNEVFAVLPLGSTFTGSYPGEATLDEYSYEVCSGQVFDTYVGIAYRDSSLEVFSFSPTEESWDDGDREFVCALYRIDFGQITGTARGTGL